MKESQRHYNCYQDDNDCIYDDDDGESLEPKESMKIRSLAFVLLTLKRSARSVTST